MKNFPESVEFIWPWRNYQGRVLSELETHLNDNHLHIIAAPGSGKTVLGLEVVRRLDAPAVIFAPTIAIRDQWADRFVSLFCRKHPDAGDWISRDIRKPRLLTLSTYQGLHSAYTGRSTTERDEDAEDETAQARHGTGRTKVSAKKQLIESLRRAHVTTMVVDEAHHLRNEWWKCLIDLKNNLDDPVVVALTATPPLDVAPAEWQRYCDMCGPVDAEICVPELVLQKNLCPHQDYVYLSTPQEAEKKQLRAFRAEIAQVLDRLYADEDFTKALLKHRCLRDPKTHIEEILSDPQFYSSIAIYLNHVTGRPPRRLLKIIGMSRRTCPPVDNQWTEVLLTGCLYKYRDDFSDIDARLADLARDLKRIGAIERRTVWLHNAKKINRLLISSLSKLKSIVEIVRIEAGTFADRLRMVILTDFIRKADMPRNANDLKPVGRIGVVPIFEMIRRSRTEGIKLGILSGSIVVIPQSARDLLEEVAKDSGIDPQNLRCTPLKHDAGFCTVRATGRGRQQIVRLITRLFNTGGITVLVGTKSLLGEGWDAPSINTLILASFVGSYMLSNQMRGRAIRTLRDNPDKTANIWHLVCTEADRKEPGEDMLMLSRRFKSFVGVSFKDTVIENGIDRLDIGKAPFAGNRIEAINETMTRMALDRPDLHRRWDRALGAEAGACMVEEVAATPECLPRSFIFANTIKALLWQGLSWVLFAFGYTGYLAGDSSTGRKYGFLFLAIAFLLAALAALPRCLKALWLTLRHGPVAGSMKQIAKALLRALVYAEVIDTPLHKMGVRAEKHEYGVVACSLNGATTYEKSIFLDALQELLSGVDNPRYLMIRKSPLGPFMRKDYLAVPTLLGRNKELAQYFTRMWKRYAGSAQLVYTRTTQGRQILLKARATAMSTAFQKRCERIKAWK